MEGNTCPICGERLKNGVCPDCGGVAEHTEVYPEPEHSAEYRRVTERTAEKRPLGLTVGNMKGEAVFCSNAEMKEIIKAHKGKFIFAFLLFPIGFIWSMIEMNYADERKRKSGAAMLGVSVIGLMITPFILGALYDMIAFLVVIIVSSVNSFAK